MCTLIKNGYRGGDVFGCHSLEKEEGKGGATEKNNMKENNFLLQNKYSFFSHLPTVPNAQFDWKKRHAQ